MITQKCPCCKSNRIRRGYRLTPWWWALVGRYNLLCNSCNWEFVGFAVPGTVSEHGQRRQKLSGHKTQNQSQTIANRDGLFAETAKLSETDCLENSNHQNINSSLNGSPIIQDSSAPTTNSPDLSSESKSFSVDNTVEPAILAQSDGTQKRIYRVDAEAAKTVFNNKDLNVQDNPKTSHKTKTRKRQRIKSKK